MPLVSLILVVYNQEKFVAEAVRGALAQTYSPLEIVFSDDCSPDGSFAVMQREVASYRGPHSVRLNRNDPNLGFAKHLNNLHTMIDGELVVVAAGDDISEPDRVSKLVDAWMQAGGGMASISSSATCIDENSKETGIEREPEYVAALDSMKILNGGAGVRGSSQAWSRTVFTLFGPMQPGSFQEDIAIPFRASLFGKLLYVDQPLVRYRRHSGGMWSGIVLEQSSSQARMRFRRWARNLVFQNMGFRRDVETAVRSGNLDAANAQRLRNALAVRRREVHTEVLVHGNKPLPVKLAGIAASVSRGTTLRKAARWTLMLTAMPIYMGLLRGVRRLAARKARAQA